MHSEPPRQVCRHFLAGQCYRNDCWFSHSTEVVVCKFWMQGKCMNGNDCPFGHTEAALQIYQETLPQSKQETLPVSVEFMDEEFPSLGGSLRSLNNQQSFTRNF